MEPLTPARKRALVLENAAGLPAALVAEHARRLDADYFNEFNVTEIEGHLKSLAGLTRQESFAFDFAPLGTGGRDFGLTVVGEDLPGFFAALTGLLASHDLDIKVGKVFSYAAEGSGLASDPWREGGATAGKIIDYLVVERPEGAPDGDFQGALLADLRGLIALLRARETQALRTDLYRRIGAYLERQSLARASQSGSALPEGRMPLEIEAEADERHAILTVRGTDSKALLFSLSNALALQGISIQKLLTKSDGERFEDRIHIVDAQGRPIHDGHALERIKVAIVLMERFISALPQASDYPAAVQAFNGFIDALMERSPGTPDLAALEDLTFLSSLAKILGAGPYLWEEMTRLPLGEVTAMLRRLDEERKPVSRRELEAGLRDVLDREPGHDGRVAALNRFKDLHLFRLEVLHLIYPRKTLQEFSAEISALAEAVLHATFGICYGSLVRAHGEPRKGADPCHYALFAQGKLGGRELGYASDLELQLVYESSAGQDDGTVGGPDPLSHAEFFSRLVACARASIHARPEGIFELDLRLRPHGDSGPLASQLDRWVEYYRPGGGALAYERQALLKLHPVSGHRAFAETVMAARDSLLFGGDPTPIEHTLGLRAKQAELLAKGLNAKFSPGGLVEVEYAVQFLQLRHGRKYPSLREPNTETALEVLLEEGILDPAEFEMLYRAYVFLRRLINGLRMVRGHSRDLVVPARGSEAFGQLAKRMGYLPGQRYDAASQLDWDLKHSMRDVHALFARRFLGTVPLDAAAADGEESVTAAFLDPAATPDRIRRALRRLGLPESASDPALAAGMLDPVREKGILCAALVVAAPKLRASPDPEAVIRHLGQYLEAVPDPDYFVRQLLNHPYLNEILIKAFGHSEYLAGILIRNPGYLMDLGDARALEKPKLLAEFRREILEMSPGVLGYEGALDSLRRYRNREYLRIGLRDIWLGETLPRITLEISQLSNALIESVFGATMAQAETISMRDGISVIALGKLGGNELNYSSDIDIVFVADSERVPPEARTDLEAWGRLFIGALSVPGAHGKMFRVDTQLRPYGAQGPLIATSRRYEEYFRGEASGWELQAWLKARPVAGNLELGRTVCRQAQAIAVAPSNREKIEASMRDVRRIGLDKLKLENRLSSEVKLGPGGIRTIEFYVQYLQILHGQSLPELISGNTLAVMGRLHRYRLLSRNYYDLLSKAYVFLRRIEHVLQLQGLQQRHEMPSSPHEIARLAKRMGFEERLGEDAASQFRARWRQHMLTLLELSATLFGYDTNLPEENK